MRSTITFAVLLYYKSLAKITKIVYKNVRYLHKQVKLLEKVKVKFYRQVARNSLIKVYICQIWTERKYILQCADLVIKAKITSEFPPK